MKVNLTEGPHGIITTKQVEDAKVKHYETTWIGSRIVRNRKKKYYFEKQDIAIMSILMYVYLKCCPIIYNFLKFQSHQVT